MLNFIGRTRLVSGQLGAHGGKSHQFAKLHSLERFRKGSLERMLLWPCVDCLIMTRCSTKIRVRKGMESLHLDYRYLTTLSSLLDQKKL